MTPTVLLLGGTTEAMQMGQALAAQGVRATISLAGRVKTPRSSRCRCASAALAV